MSIRMFEGVPFPVAFATIEEFKAMSPIQGFNGLMGLLFAGGIMCMSTAGIKEALKDPAQYSNHVSLYGQEVVDFLTKPETTHLISILTDMTDHMSEDELRAMLFHECGHIELKHIERLGEDLDVTVIGNVNYLDSVEGEIEADNYAMDHTSPKDLKYALIKLFERSADIIGKLSVPPQDSAMLLECFMNHPQAVARFDNIRSRM